MKLNKDIVDLINDMVERGYIKKTKHPSYDLYAYKYTVHATLDNMWNDATCLCRGLVLDSKYNVIAYPMTKFFNYEELEESKAKDIMSVQFQVHEKMDGSLGILVHYNNEYFICTQGSFTSEQAIWATKLLNEKYLDKVKSLDTDKYTYLFEIVYPENKIVVDYGDFADLVFLARINKESGEDELLPDSIVEDMKPFCVAKRFKELEKSDFNAMKSLNLENKEGFVVHSKKGRLKIKFEKYFDLHKIVFGLCEKSVWRAMNDGNDAVKTMRNNLPEEFWNWFDETLDSLEAKICEIEVEIKAEHHAIKEILGNDYSQKDFALLNLKRNKGKKSGLVFNLEYNKDNRKEILKMIEPIGGNYIK